MKIKRIMLITFLLLAVLAIGAVSAVDDIASDNMTVSDDVDVIAEDDDDYYGIDITEYDIIIDEEEYDIAWITLPEITKGSFQILNGEDTVAQVDVDTNDDDHWDDDDPDELYGWIMLSDFNLRGLSINP